MQNDTTYDGMQDDLTKLAAAGKVSTENDEEITTEDAPEDLIEQDPVNIQYDDPELNEAKKEERKRQEAERAEKLEEELGL